MAEADIFEPDDRVELIDGEVFEKDLSLVRIGQHADVTFEAYPGEVFDAVVVDAPCSGLGTVRRHPEIRLRRGQVALDELSELQLRLLRAAAERVRPGGSLVYSVCTPLPQEGRDVVRAFLAETGRDGSPRFVLEPARDVLPWLPADAVSEEGFVRLQVHRHQADAFFAARLVRQGGETTREQGS